MVVLAVALITGTAGVWGQATDLSGTYRIANHNTDPYSPTNIATNWYLCPAELYYDGSNSSATQNVNETPFLTTYQLFKDTYVDPKPAMFEWKIERVGDGDEYRIIHIETGKYAILNGTVSGYQAHRLKLHLETITNLDDNKLLFVFAKNNPNNSDLDFYTIRPKSITKTSDHRFVTPSGGNKDYFADGTAFNGLIGLYNTVDNGTRWHLEPIVAQPQIIENEADGYVTITCATDGATIKYVIDNPNPSESDYTLYTPGDQISTDNHTQIIAVAQKGDLTSNLATFFIARCDQPVITNNYTDQNTFTITCGTTGATIYYTTNGAKPTKNSPTISDGGSINLTESMTMIRAFAGNVADTRDSKEASYTILKSPTPSASFDQDGKVVLTSDQVNGANNTTVNPTIRYKVDGSDPKRNNGTQYSTPFNLELGQTVVKAVSYSPGYLTSDVMTFTPARCADPIISYDNATYQLTISTSTPGATLYYTIDNGSVNTVNSSTVVITEGLQHGLVFRAWAGKKGMTYSDITLFELSIQCATPVFLYAGGLLQIQSSTNGASIYYVIGGDTNPTSNSTPYSTPIGNLQPGTTVRAIACKSGFKDSEVGVFITPYPINSLSDIQNMSGSYIISDNFSFTGTLTGTFSGTLDGQYLPIQGVDEPLFESLDGATLKNLVLGGVSISGNGNVGAIACVATGNSRIYNCGITDSGSSVAGSVTGSVGGLIGEISGNTRVINCYSFASVSGGEYTAGIVGKNSGSASNGPNGTRIANCVMYGSVSGSATHRSPVYAGNHTSNVKNFTEYNYFRFISNPNPEEIFTEYNDQLAIDDDEYLTRFPFYRHILNNHHELAAYFLFGTTSVDQLEEWQINEVGHWYLPDDSPFPIIETWHINTKKTLTASPSNILADCGNAGYLAVTVIINGTTFNANLPITGMDPDRFDYTWGKVVLPFAGEFEGWTRDNSKICTGWKITKVDSETSAQITNYNFADRNNKKKDIYDAQTNPYVFAQGGKYIVPYGVKSITIQANFANAFYLSDASYEVGFSANYTEPTALGGTVHSTYHGQQVYTSLPAIMANMAETTDPNAQAIVLVGNYHYNQISYGKDKTGFDGYTNKALTIMSVDEDNNQEPDYGWYCYHSSMARTPIPPLRFDFLPNIGLGMAARVNGSMANPTIAIWNSQGWFELTETCVSIMTQCEIESYNYNAVDNGYGNNRWIVNSGYFTQIVRSKANNCNKLSYIQIGANAYVKELYPGSHSDVAKTTTLVPIVVTGGEIEQCFMTGYSASAKVSGTDIRFFCAGGYIHKFLGMYMEGPASTNNKLNTVNMTAKIDHAKIDRFFGGGTSASARITGNIDVTIDNSEVGFYCGGPEFGDMVTGKTVTTTAHNTTFGEFYGAGFGGTSITYNREVQNEYKAESDKNAFKPAFTYYTSKRLATKSGYGIGTCYKFEYIQQSQGSGGLVARFFTGYAQFSLATTGNVTNNLTDCTIQNNFYGAGCQGKVAGTVQSTLTDCTITGSVYGGGYKAQSNSVDVYPTTQPEYSEYIKELGIFTDFGTVEPETYTWTQGNSAPDQGNKLLYTSVNMSDLGNVTGAISLTINGQTTVDNDVFGGGNESPSRNNTQVTIDESAVINGTVYGGGNQADVEGNTLVNVHNGTLKDVFGGGNMANVGGDVTVNIGKDDGTSVIAIQGDVYGGGALAFTNTANRSTTTVNQVTQEIVNLDENSKKTVVNLYPGATINGDVYGGGKGKAPTQGDPGEAIVYGNVTVYQFGAVLVPQYSAQGLAESGRIFGCNNVNGSPRGHALVYIKKTARNQSITGPYDLAAVYGGGNKAEYLPYYHETENSDSAEVMIDPDDCDDITIHSVYGGGNAASTPATKVTINGGEIEYLFGGGNGAGEDNPGANVGYHAYSDHTGTSQEDIDYRKAHYMYGSGKASTNILGGTIHHIYGGSNTLGNVRYASIVKLDGVGTCPLVIDDEIHGGGRDAYMEGKTMIDLGCITGMNEIYGGSEKADVGGDIELTITSGTYGKVFGGNNKGGRVYGSITLNIEQTGCLPIVIDELYLGGNNAPYSVYGYTDQTSTVDIGGEEITQYQPKTRQQYLDELSGGDPNYDPDQDPNYKQPYDDPVLNIRSFDRIGTVYGGGNGEHATMIGNPTVDINVTQGYIDGKYAGDEPEYQSYKVSGVLQENGNPKYGVIETVFGGGNEADVKGTTNIRIGDKTGSQVTLKSTNQSEEVKGATITGNVYGGGNEANVTDGTNIKVGPDD